MVRPEAEYNLSPSPLKTTDAEGPGITLTRFPVDEYQTVICRSPPDAILPPSGQKATEYIGPLSTRALGLSLPVTSHNLIVPSQLPDARTRPSGRNTTDQTKSSCPSKVRISCQEFVSHSLIVLSRLPVASNDPSGLNANVVT